MNLQPLSVLLALWLVCAASGYGLAHTLWPRAWASQRVLAMPILGAAWLTVVSGGIHSLGLPLGPLVLPIIASGPIMGGIAWLSRRGNPRPGTAWRDVAWISALGLAGAIATLFPLILWRAWNPYNDAFLNCAVADNLLAPSPTRPLDENPFDPISIIARGYRAGPRLGSRLLLGLFSAALGYRFSCDIFPAFVSLAASLGVSGMWLFCRHGLLMGRRGALVASAFYALHLGVPIPNALVGFMPQTWAVAFMLPAIAAWLRAAGRHDQRRRVALAGLLFAALLATYPPVVPLTFLAVATVVFGRALASHMPPRTAFRIAALPATIGVLLLPVAAYHALVEMGQLAAAPSGWDPRFGVWDYLLIVNGHQSVLGGLGTWPEIKYAPIKLAALLSVVITAYGVARGPRHATRQICGLGFIFLAAIVYFATVATNPWNPGQRGSPYQTFKVFSYGFFLLPPLWALGCEALAKGRSPRRWIPWLTAAILAAYFASALERLALTSAHQMRLFTGNRADPLGEYGKLVEALGTLPTDQPLNLYIDHAYHKHQQMISYYLRRPLVARWYDEYVGPRLPPGRRRPPIDPRYPALVFAPGGRAVVAANLRLVREPRLLWTIGAGWRGLESDGHSWSIWLDHTAYINVFAREPSQVFLTGSLLAQAPERRLSIALEGRPGSRFDAKVSPGGHEVRTPPFLVPPGEHRIVLAAGESGTQAGAPRPKGLVRVMNLEITLVRPRRVGQPPEPPSGAGEARPVR